MTPREIGKTLMALLNFRKKTDDTQRPDPKVERFLALNGLSGNAALAPGQKVKLVTY